MNDELDLGLGMTESGFVIHLDFTSYAFLANCFAIGAKAQGTCTQSQLAIAEMLLAGIKELARADIESLH